MGRTCERARARICMHARMHHPACIHMCTHAHESRVQCARRAAEASYIVMACIVMAYMIMADTIIAYADMACVLWPNAGTLCSLSCASLLAGAQARLRACIRAILCTCLCTHTCPSACARAHARAHTHAQVCSDGLGRYIFLGNNGCTASSCERYSRVVPLAPETKTERAKKKSL